MLEFFSRFDFFNKIFKLGESRQAAKERLQLVLIHDRSSVSPQIMEALKEDLIKVISRYLEIDISALEIGVERRDGMIAFAANIPIKSIKRNTEKTIAEKISENGKGFIAQKLEEAETQALAKSYEKEESGEQAAFADRKDSDEHSKSDIDDSELVSKKSANAIDSGKKKGTAGRPRRKNKIKRFSDKKKEY